MKRKGFSLQDFTVEDILNLMDVYLSEWTCRVEHLWNLIIKFFYANLVVLFLPNISSVLGIDYNDFHPSLFPAISSLLSVVFMYVTVANAKRVEASGKTYQNIINLLPPELRRVSVANSEVKFGKYFRNGLNSTLCILMFSSLLLLSIFMFFHNLNHYK